MEPNLDSLFYAWRVAGVTLGIRVESPYWSDTKVGGRVCCIAHLPDFGSPRGMLIGVVTGPEFETDEAVIRLAEDLGKYYSFINASVYEKYNECIFREALEDWGYWGSLEDRPQWLPNQP